MGGFPPVPVPIADPVRLQKALEWYQTGTERGEENCIYELGDYYRKGIIVPQDRKKAFDLYRKAPPMRSFPMKAAFRSLRGMTMTAL